jgi:prolyl-tRNA editing enzyme YbaK/EbsC (Cys-tRNA(Pro) deacylase)
MPQFNRTNKTFRVFVGSASEARPIDRQIRAILDDLNTEVLAWRGILGPGEVLIDGLLSVCDRVDAAILIASADDLVESRGVARLSPRDNILLEIGIFLARLGRERVLIIQAIDHDGNTPKLPTDLEGLLTMRFDPNKPNKLEHDLDRWLARLGADSLKNKVENSIEIGRLRNVLNAVPDENWPFVERYVLQKFNQDIDLLDRREVLLTQSEYYAELYREIDRADQSTEIIAVATLSAEMWLRDPEQAAYVQKNIGAAKRGAKIRRLFICSDRDWDEIRVSLSAQIESGIELRRANTMIYRDIKYLEDMVIFAEKNFTVMRGYLAEQDFYNPHRIRRGRVFLDASKRKATINAFWQAWRLASVVKPSVKAVDSLPSDRGPPGENMEEYVLGKNVVSCEEAAGAKGIPLENELKTLILHTTNGFVALHVRGNRSASLRSVKAALGVDQARMASNDQLRDLGLQPGTVCPILNPVWSMPHLLSRSILALDYVSTNSGKLNAFFKFRPEILLDTDSISIGDFEAT